MENGPFSSMIFTYSKWSFSIVFVGLPEGNGLPSKMQKLEMQQTNIIKHVHENEVYGIPFPHRD